MLLAGGPAWCQAPHEWDWAKRLDDAFEDVALAIAVDSSSQTMYTAGKAIRGLQRFSGGAAINTGMDGYLVKQGLDGSHRWQFTMGGAGDDAIAGVCVDPAGYVYVTGWFSGNNATFKGTTGESKLLSSSGGKDLFVAKYSPAGELQWRTKAGGALDEAGTGICYYGGKLFVTGSYRSSVSILPGATSSKAVLLAINPANGDLLWQFYGGNNELSSFNAVAADAERIYVIGDYKGTSYSFSGTNSTTAALALPPGYGRSAQIVAVNHSGQFGWAQTVSNPLEDMINATAIAVGHTGLYIGGSTHNGSIFPGGTTLTLPTSVHDVGYVARLNKHTGSTESLAPFTGSADHVQVVRGIALDSHEDILVTGSYHTTATYLDQITFSGSSTEQIFVVKATRHGLVKWALTPEGYGPDRSYGIATDRAGMVAIVGSFTGSIEFRAQWTGNATDNLFMAVLHDPNHAVQAFHDPSRFVELGPLCASDGPVDLNSLLIPMKSGMATTTNVELAAAGDVVTIDLGDTLPALEHAIIHWQGSDLDFTTVNVMGSLDPYTGFTDLGTITASSSELLLTGVMTTTPVRYIRLTHLAGPGCMVAAIHYTFGSTPDGIWSGPGVSGHLFDPSGLGGNVVIRYDAYTHSTEQQVIVSAESAAGAIQGGGTVCPGSSILLTMDQVVGESITWHQQIDGQSSWSADPSNTDTYTLAQIDQPIHVFAKVTSGTCAPAYSDTILVSPEDDEAPVFINCPGDTIVYVPATACDVQVVYVPPVATDNCGEPDMSINLPAHQPGQAFPLGTTIVTYTAVDQSGNTAVCKFKITVLDTLSPSITCPDAITTVSNGVCSASGIELGTPVMSDNCGTPTLSNNAPSTFPVGSNTVIWTVTDASGNTATCNQIITVIVGTPPTITCPDEVTVFTDSGCTATNVTLGSAGVWDDCGQVISLSDAPSIFPVDTTIVTWTAFDGHGNSASCTQRVVVIDHVSPSIICPDPVTVSANTGCNATGVELGIPTTQDNCGTMPAWSDAPASFAMGSTTVVWTVSDDHGNSASCNQLITVIDDVAPVVTCGDTITAAAGPGCTTMNVLLGTPVATDNCGLASLLNDAPQSFPLHETIVTWAATDSAGNTSTCQQVVVVIDTTPPSIACPSAVIASTNDGCTATAVNLGTPVATDHCGAPELTNNAPVAFPLGVTGVIWTATDATGNASTCTQQVTIVDNKPPDAQCRPVSITLDADGIATVTVAQVDNGSSDNCTVASISLTTTVYYAVGTYTDTLIVIDASGNSDTCFATITVLDESAPTALCNDLTLYLDTDGQASLTTNDLDGGSFDNGTIVAMHASQAVFTCADLGHNDVTLTVTEDGGNTNFCIATVTVLDTIMPNTGGFATAGFCAGGEALHLSTLITENLAGNGSWSAPDGTPFPGLFDPVSGQPGLYTYAAPSLAGCGTDTFRVEVELYPLPFAGDDTSLILCSTGPVVDLFGLISGTDPDGSWSIGTNLFDPSVHGSGTVSYILTNDHGCAPDTAFVDVTVFLAPHAGANGNLDICTDAAALDLFALLGNAPDVTGWWSAPNGDPFTGLFDPALHDAGLYTYTVDGTAPCISSSAVVTVNVVNAPTAAWTAPGPICASADMLDLAPYVTGTAGGTWSGAGISNGHYFDPDVIAINGASAEVVLEYTVSIAGCSASAPGTMTVYANPLADAGGNASVCGLEHFLSPLPTIGAGSWSTNGTASIADPHGPGTMVVTDATGDQIFLWTVVNGTCTASDNAIITFHLPEELTVLDAGEDRSQDIRTSMELDGQADGATEVWWSVAQGSGFISDPSALGTTISGLAIGRNVVILSARIGNCPAEHDTVILTVRGLVIPTGFSPNGDGVNDSYVIHGLDELPPATLDVFDRWGNPVFHAAPYRNDWSGHGDNGQPLMDGTYFGIVTMAGQDPWKGSITLKR